MTRLAGIVALFVSLGGPAMAAEIQGEWLVKDQQARIGIAPCPPAPAAGAAAAPGAPATPTAGRAAPGSPPAARAGAAPPASTAAAPDTPLCGNIVWTKTPGGTDDKNPDPAKRSRPVLGLEILLAMKQTGPNKWEGSVYNAENGKIYKAAMSLQSDDELRMEGCIMGGLLCGGETWTRHKEIKDAQPKGTPGTLTKAKAAPPRP
jgi:hypothetical protein